MILPTIHANGTPRQTLKDGYLAAYSGVLKAMAALAQVELNARDYYPQGDEAFRKAVAQAVQARNHLDACKTYLGTIINHLMETP